MKTAPPTQTPDHFCNTTTLQASLYQLCEVLAGGVDCARTVLKLSNRLAAMVRVIIKAERHNKGLRLKRAMLADPIWRGRVCRDLGGALGLERWARYYAKATIRLKDQNTQPDKAAKPAIKTFMGFDPKCALMQEKAARAARAARICARFKAANRHALIFTDRVKVDFEGQFRLAPIPRQSSLRRSSCPRGSALNRPRSGERFRAGFAPISLFPHDLRAKRGNRQARANHPARRVKSDCLYDEQRPQSGQCDVSGLSFALQAGAKVPP